MLLWLGVHRDLLRFLRIGIDAAREGLGDVLDVLHVNAVPHEPGPPLRIVREQQQEEEPHDQEKGKEGSQQAHEGAAAGYTSDCSSMCTVPVCVGKRHLAQPIGHQNVVRVYVKKAQRTYRRKWSVAHSRARAECAKTRRRSSSSWRAGCAC